MIGCDPNPNTALVSSLSRGIHTCSTRGSFTLSASARPTTATTRSTPNNECGGLNNPCSLAELDDRLLVSFLGDESLHIQFPKPGNNLEFGRGAHFVGDLLGTACRHNLLDRFVGVVGDGEEVQGLEIGFAPLTPVASALLDKCCFFGEETGSESAGGSKLPVPFSLMEIRWGRGCSRAGGGVVSDGIDVATMRGPPRRFSTNENTHFQHKTAC